MTKEELAQSIKDKVVLIGTDIRHLESIIKYSSENSSFRNAFETMFISLQNSAYIELFKIFDDSGEDTKKLNIYALINMIEDDKKTYHKMISKYQTDIDSIKNLRNKCFAHNTVIDWSEIIKKNPIHNLQDLLTCITDICCSANEQLYPNTYASNVRDFDDWCRMATDAISKISELNSKIILAGITVEEFYNGLDQYINGLKYNSPISREQ